MGDSAVGKSACKSLTVWVQIPRTQVKRLVALLWPEKKQRQETLLQVFGVHSTTVEAGDNCWLLWENTLIKQLTEGKIILPQGVVHHGKEVKAAENSVKTRRKQYMHTRTGDHLPFSVLYTWDPHLGNAFTYVVRWSSHIILVIKAIPHRCSPG